MSTYKYFDRLQGGGSGWVISHAFTSNKPELQEEAGELLVTIQEDVELRRASGANPGIVIFCWSYAVLLLTLWPGRAVL